ncbi:MAG: hypothetical protein EOP09_06485 [Proteobacteria bacterium]|nr:MAG: hypothetical protein EOP09_06485 [Pseudomonadota bacterium]
MAVNSRKENGRQLGPLIREFFLATQFGSQLIVVTLIFIGLAGFFAFRAFTEQYVQIQEIFQVIDAEMQHELVMNDIVRQNMVGLLVSIIAYIAAMIFFIVRSHHKYTGPLVAVTKFTQSITNGYYSARVNLRKKDTHMRELETALNEMAKELERRHGNGIDPSKTV